MLELPNLPEEVIFDILSRLPVVSLCRFRCVSKPWRFLFSSPLFTRAHLNRNTNNKKHEHLALCCKRSHLYSLDFEWSPSVGEVLVKPLTKLDLDCDKIYGSCDGMLLTRICMEDEGVHYSLVNPSIGEFRRLPPSPFVLNPWSCEYGFGYDSKSDDYKVVGISHDRDSVGIVVSVYSLRTDSWKKIEKYPYYSLGTWQSGVLVSGALHWFTETSTGDVIIAFILADETLRILPYTGSMDVELTVLGGCLCVFGGWDNDGRVDFCVMKEYGINDSWTKFTVTTSGYLHSFWKPLSLSRTGQVMFQVNYRMLVLFDLQEKNSKRVRVHGLPTNIFDGLPAYFGVETYVESLVSPNRQW